MLKGKLYGVGVGPGDKELITVKAARTLERCDIIAVPRTKNGDTAAFDIIEEYVRGKEITELDMPMSKDIPLLEKSYRAAALKLGSLLDEGKDTAFVTLGDPTVYSTYMRINREVLSMGYETEIIPGVTSFCAAAARLNISLCERDEPLVVLPASYESVREGLRLYGTKVLMKPGKDIGSLVGMLAEEDLLENTYAAQRCGMDGERLCRPGDGIDMQGGYFSLMIVKESK